jgi:hypothetical protein
VSAGALRFTPAQCKVHAFPNRGTKTKTFQGEAKMKNPKFQTVQPFQKNVMDAVAYRVKEMSMKNRILGIVIAVCFACCAFAQDSAPAHALRTFNKNLPPTTNCNGTPCDINYHGGIVFEDAPTVYIIYYGDWRAGDKSIIDYYFEHLSGTSQEKINTTYSDNTNRFITGTLKHSTKNDYHDNYSLGKSIRDAQIQEIVANAIKNKHLPADPNGIYFVLTYKDVLDPDGFCIPTGFCGYHGPSQSIVSGDIIKYAMVGDPDQCRSLCDASQVIGDKGTPNNNHAADGTVNIMWHEFSESSSDPKISLDTAWSGNFCGESGDCCAWLFGTLKLGSNGAHYTNTIGSKNFLTQELLQLKTTSRSGNVPAECENVYLK